MTAFDRTTTFDENCRLCPRLANFLSEVRRDNNDYYAKPVPSFGDAQARFIIVGLAPGMHGANRTGRPFTGDHAGILLYETLYRHGFSNQAKGEAIDDGLQLIQCRIANAVKCLPPQNKPTGAEIKQCNQYLINELAMLPRPAVVVALGTIAHGAVLTALGCKAKAFKFAHGAMHELPAGYHLIDSYHCSRYNTQTKRLTAKMFDEVFLSARKQLDRLVTE